MDSDKGQYQWFQRKGNTAGRLIAKGGSSASQGGSVRTFSSKTSKITISSWNSRSWTKAVENRCIPTEERGTILKIISVFLNLFYVVFLRPLLFKKPQILGLVPELTLSLFLSWPPTRQLHYNGNSKLERERTWKDESTSALCFQKISAPLDDKDHKLSPGKQTQTIYNSFQ